MKRVLYLFVLLLTMAACKSVKYVPVETVKTDSIYLSKLIRDSIYVHDSIYVKEKNDTVFQYRYKYIYKDVAVHDTAYIERTDTISVPYPIEAQLTKWEKFKMKTGTITIIAVIIIILIVFGRFVYRLRK